MGFMGGGVVSGMGGGMGGGWWDGRWDGRWKAEGGMGGRRWKVEGEVEGRRWKVEGGWWDRRWDGSGAGDEGVEADSGADAYEGEEEADDCCYGDCAGGAERCVGRPGGWLLVGGVACVLWIGITIGAAYPSDGTGEWEAAFSGEGPEHS